MSGKTPKIADVTSPGKVAPSASSRPIVVTNHSMLGTDPMMVSAKSDNASGDPGTAPVVNRTAKTIAPVSADMVTPDEATADTVAADTPAPQAAEESHSSEVTKPNGADGENGAPERDVEAETAAAETEAAAAQEARQQELQQLIDSGKYVVPINAVRRKRSRMFVATMCVLAVVLALLLADLVLDANILKLSVNVPHTHFFSQS